jgi:hypothetical protein
MIPFVLLDSATLVMYDLGELLARISDPDTAQSMSVVLILHLSNANRRRYIPSGD